MALVIDHGVHPRADPETLFGQLRELYSDQPGLSRVLIELACTVIAEDGHRALTVRPRDRSARFRPYRPETAADVMLVYRPVGVAPQVDILVPLSADPVEVTEAGSLTEVAEWIIELATSARAEAAASLLSS